MSRFDYLMQRVGVRHVELRGVPMQFADGTAAFAPITAFSGPEDSKMMTATGGTTQELYRVRQLEFNTVDFPTATPLRGKFKLDGTEDADVWTINQILSGGPTLTVVEIVRPERSDRAGRAKASRT